LHKLFKVPEDLVNQLPPLTLIDMTASSALFQPIRVGNSQLSHRIVLAPLTRFRANKEHVHGELALKYYEQRSRTPGSLLITEATFIAAKAGGNDHVPGIWNDDQISAWKKVRKHG
jgi:NADPH2 dehydrogenase